jgi:ClpP class serine protease
MDIQERVKRYKALEDYRKRPLIVFATSTRGNAQGRMAADSVREFIDQIEEIPKEVSSVDVMINSMGGDGLTAWKLMATLRERFKDITVLVPFVAFSAATLFALGADEIVLHPFASLGPIDPQITENKPDGTKRQFAFEDMGAFLNFLKKDAEITDETLVTQIVDKLFSTVDPLTVGAAKRASELAEQMGERLLLTHVEDKTKAKQIAVNLNKSFFAHGDAVTKSRAKNLELKISEPDPELDTLLWEAFLAIEDYMELRTPFNPHACFLSDKEAAASIAATAPLNLPPNIPTQMAQQVWNAEINKALTSANNPGKEVGYSVVNAIIESSRISSEFRTSGKISAVRMPTGEVKVSIVNLEAHWKRV